MLSKELKDLLRKNINKIQVNIENDAHQIETLVVTDVKFDILSRNQLYLIGTRYPKPRTDKFYAIKSFCLDFKDTRDVLIKDLEKNKVYHILSNYVTNEIDKVLTLNVSNVGGTTFTY